MPLDAAVPVARAFSQFLNLANVAEQHHRIRRRRAHQRDPLAGPQPHSLEETLPRLAASGVAGAAARSGARTAHRAGGDRAPDRDDAADAAAQVQRIAGALEGLDRRGTTPLEQQTLVDTLRREITAAWETEEMRRDRPSPLDEVRSALAVFEHTMWDAVPEYLRSLDRTLVAVTGSGLPLDAAPIRFGSWIGGDRDGNPSITPEVTRRACLASRWIALTLYARDVAALGERAVDVGGERGAARVDAGRVRAVPGAAAHGPARARVDATGGRRAALVTAWRPRRSSRRGGLPHRRRI